MDSLLNGVPLTLVLVCMLAGSKGQTISIEKSIKDDYLDQRSKFIAEELGMRLGNKVALSPAENTINDKLMEMKRKVIDDSMAKIGRPVDYSSFYLSKRHIDSSPIYKFIQKMPKGGALHLHDLTMGNAIWVVKNATYRPHAKMCFDSDGDIKLASFDKVPPTKTPCEWVSVEVHRNASGDSDAFDFMLIKNITMMGNDPVEHFDSSDEAWARFSKIYQHQVADLLYHAPVFRDYVLDTLEDFYNDNVQSIELRVDMDNGRVFNLDEERGSLNDTVAVYKEAIEEFLQRHPDFVGLKLIMTSMRVMPLFTNARVLQDLQDTIRLQELYPGFVVGFDVIGQEDKSKSLEYYLDTLLYPSQQDPPLKMNYFFHAGETNWQETAIDYNLVDAVLLNASRIGHGYALTKHPNVAQMVKDKDIAVEINPISNQQLGLVKDLRNHPSINLMANSFPVVVSSDDRFLWGAAPLSHDFYLAFMALSGRETDLRFLKQLASNSVKYNAMPYPEKGKAWEIWGAKWSAFIEEIAHEM